MAEWAVCVLPKRHRAALLNYTFGGGGGEHAMETVTAEELIGQAKLDLESAQTVYDCAPTPS